MEGQEGRSVGSRGAGKRERERGREKERDSVSAGARERKNGSERETEKCKVYERLQVGKMKSPGEGKMIPR